MQKWLAPCYGNPVQKTFSFSKKPKEFILIHNGRHSSTGQVKIVAERATEITSTQKNSTGYMPRKIQKRHFLKA